MFSAALALHQMGVDGLSTIACTEAKSVVESLSCVQFLCDPVDCSLPDSPVHGILQARILEWVAISSSRGPSQPGIEAASPALAGGFFTTERQKVTLS